MQLLFRHDDHDRLMIMAGFGVNWGQPQKKRSKQKTNLYSKYAYNIYLEICVWLLKIKVMEYIFPAVTNRL